MERLRYLNKIENPNERQNFNGWWREQIEIYGQEVVYYVNVASLSGSSFLYGEEPSAGFVNPQPIVVLLNLNQDSILLSKFGLIADSDMSGVIHYDMYCETYGLSAEPRAGDVMSLVEFGADRLNYPRRGPNSYEITEVIDEFQGNPIAGHYVWFFKAKRYDYSYEGGGPGSETGGPGPGLGNKPLDDNDNANEAAKENFDYDVDNPCNNTSVYGDY
jgi:hypothetical protein